MWSRASRRLLCTVQPRHHVARASPLTRSSVSGAIDPAKLKQSEACPSMGYAKGQFPWTQVFEKHRRGDFGFFSYIESFFLRHVVELVIATTMRIRHREAAFYLKEIFPQGAALAFRRATGAIFELRGDALRSHSGPEFAASVADPQSSVAVKGEADSEGEGGVDEADFEEIVAPDDVMERNLARFFMEAMASCRCAGHTVTYGIDESMPLLASVSAFRFYMGLESRDMDASNHIVMSGTNGFFMYIPVEKGSKTISSHWDFFDYQTPSLIQIDVDVTLSEGFKVKDGSGGLIQGSESPAQVVHRVTLESLFAPVKRPGEMEWTVVDIDGWSLCASDEPFPPKGLFGGDV